MDSKKNSSRFQIQAFAREFWPLFVWPDNKLATRTSPMVRDDRVERMRVARVTKELLQSRPSYRGATGNCVDLRDDEAVFLLDKDFGVLGEVRQQRDVYHNAAHSDPEWEEGETVGEAIARMGCEESTAYILKRHTGYEVRNHHSVGGYCVVLYKAPRGWTIPGWIEEEQRRADAQVAAQVAALEVE